MTELSLEQDIESSIDYLYLEAEETQRFKTLFLQHKSKFKAATAYYSGGGHRHMFIHLNSGKIIVLHTVNEDVEISYKAWESLDDYIDYDYDNSKQNEGGFAWEFEAPDYDNRIGNFENLETFLVNHAND